MAGDKQKKAEDLTVLGLVALTRLTLCVGVVLVFWYILFKLATGMLTLGNF